MSDAFNTYPSTHEVQLTGGERTSVWRRGEIVLRPRRYWSENIIGFLAHLESCGFEGSPRVEGSGFAADGREAVRFIDGDAGHLGSRSDSALLNIGQMIRKIHDASTSFTPINNQWQTWFGRSLGGPQRVIGHCDVGSWNVIARNSEPVAFIDWELAGPVDPMVELAQACWLNAQLMGEQVAERNELPDVKQRARQMRVLVDGYGASQQERTRIFDLMVELVIGDAKLQADDAGVTPETKDAAALWGITWRVASAEWMFRNGSLLRNALV